MHHTGERPPQARAPASLCFALVSALLLLSACAPRVGDREETAEGTQGTAGTLSTSDGEVAASAKHDQIRAQVVAVLERQQAAWNRGDLDQFMADYVRGERLRFASGGTVRRGWQTTLERYRTTYPDRAAMGELEFSQLEVTVLGERYAEVHGRWQLQREDDAPGGRFTLLFERDPAAGAWRILHDHTSSD